MNEEVGHVVVWEYTHTHTHSGILLSHKNGTLPLAMTWMELECIMLSEISQRRIPYDFIHGI